MMGDVLTYPPSPVAAALKKARALMDVLLHVGAHRTGSTSFQYYMRHNADDLRKRGIAFWGPQRLRSGLFAGLFDGLRPGRKGGLAANTRMFNRAVGRVRLNCAGQIRKHTRQLIVSEEMMLGSTRDNLRRSQLYKGAGERLSRVSQAFDGQIGRVVLTIRSLENYWASALAYAVQRGAPVPGQGVLDRIVTQPRSWRDVITDISCAMPGAQILVVPFERMIGRPDELLEYMTYGAFAAPQVDARCWRNRSAQLRQLRQELCDRGLSPGQSREILGQGDGRWNPFDASQEAALKEIYADDLFWLRAGADGLALLIEETALDTAGQLSGKAMTRGQTDDQERRMARTR